MTKAEAIQYLKDRGMYSRGRQAIKSRAKKYVISKPHIRGKITPDKFDELKRKLRQSTRSEEHTSELQSLMRISYAVFCLKKKISNKHTKITPQTINK